MFVSTVESHLASNVHKSRLVQKDLQVAKKLQEEEDKRAKIKGQKQQGDMWVSLSHQKTHTHAHEHHLYNVCLYQSKIALPRDGSL